MKVGILGSGPVGQTLGKAFAETGHDVIMGTRDPHAEKIKTWVSKTGNGVKAGTFEEAAKSGEIIVICSLFRAVENIIKLAGKENFKGKIVIDTTNPIADVPPKDGVLTYVTGNKESAGELIQKWLPDSHVVKAFNSVGNAFMYKPHFEEGTPTMFICGNNEDAKKKVTGILTSFGLDTYDSGSIAASNALEGLCIIWCARGFKTGNWNHAFKVLTK
jgi:predicted dinucleotide-binding enzyme